MRSIEQILKDVLPILREFTGSSALATNVQKLADEVNAAIKIGVEDVGVQLKRDEKTITIGEREMTGLLVTLAGVEQGIEFASLCAVLASEDNDDDDQVFWYNVTNRLRRTARTASGA